MRTLGWRNTIGCVSPTPQELQTLIDANLRALEARDLEATLATWTPDIVLYDPHYPTPNMIGKEEAAKGITWALSQIASFGFTIDRYFYSADGTGAAVETRSHHVMRVGKTLDFNQVFTYEFRDGLISKQTAYEPYGPNGVTGFGLRLGHFFHRLTSKRKK